MRRLALFFVGAIQKLSGLSLCVAAAFIGLLALLGAADIFGTSILGAPVASALELSEAALAIIVFMGLAQAERRRAHITVDIFSGRFRGWAAKASMGAALISAMLFFGFLAWRGYIAAEQSVLIDERSAGQSAFPIWPGKILLALGAFAAMLEALRQFVRLCAGCSDPSESAGGLS